MSELQRPLLAVDRVRAYLTLVPYLLERGEVSIADAASDFGVSEREMRAMVEKLTVIGLPGDNGHWQQPHELFDINWDLLDERGVIEITNDVALRRVPRFTAQEAAALLAGLQLVAAMPGVSDAEVVATLMAKLARSAASTPADVVIVPSAVDDVREVVADALQRQKAVAFTYHAPDAAPTTRTVDPLRVMVTNGQWYLQGWCHLRRATRTFHLDRVSEAHPTDIAITHSEASAPSAVSADEQSVTVVLPSELVSVVFGDLRGEMDEIAPGRSSLELMLADPRSVKRLAGRGGGSIEVTAPAVAREATRAWAAAGLALYNSP